MDIQGQAGADSIPLYRRVVIKAGTGVLTGGTDQLDLALIDNLGEQVAHLRQQDIEVVVVTSGAVAAGRQILGIGRYTKGIPLRQTLAAVGQSRLMHVYEGTFSQHGVVAAQVLVTWSDLADRLGYLNVRNTFMALLDLGVVPVVNENDVVGVEELTGETIGDNDHLSALIANLVDADLLVLLTDTGGLYTDDPRRNPKAELIRRLAKVDASVEALAIQNQQGEGRGGMIAKLQAVRLATASGLTVVIAPGRESNVVPRLLKGDELGTFFPPTANKRESRKRWMFGALSHSAQVVVDAGAVKALVSHHGSLLPAGIVTVKGQFARGAIVSIMNAAGERFACGIANYNSTDLRKIQGVRSARIAELLDNDYGEEVVHRNNLVVL